MTFADVMILTRTVSSNAAFEDEECEAYFDLLMSMVPHSLVIEVGLQYGRSSSVALQVCKERNLRYHGIDPFIEGADAAGKWLELARKVGGPYQLSMMYSDAVLIGEPISIILIDGDHSYQGVVNDCDHFLHLVKKGGYACFHDYGRESLPEVYNAVRDFMDGNQHWTEHQHVGTLGVWRRR